MAPGNVLPFHGNEKTMNMNTMILTNIQSSPYFKVNLFELKTYHEVVDEIYYKVSHMEPWEKGSRKTSGQTGMCGGVRGVGAGGIVSSAYCLLYKLYTLKLTRKQLTGLINHSDSPYIRGIGFMFIRYTQPPADLWSWYEEYLDDEEEIDVKAGGGHSMTIGEMLRQWLTKLEWYSTLFPRLPVPVQKNIMAELSQRPMENWGEAEQESNKMEEHIPSHRDDKEPYFGEAARVSQLRNPRSSRSPDQWSSNSRGGSRSKDRRSPVRRPKSRSPGYRRSSDKDRHSYRDRHRSRSRDRQRRSHDRDRRRSSSRDRDRKRRSRSHERSKSHKHSKRSRSRDRHEKHRHRSRSRERSSKHRGNSYERDLDRERQRHKHSSNGDRYH
ncbi:unnamed protein product [Owenia fusiformis]|uniref:Pre-mRNA-splicing factor 38 n=1 Tax=Owenia fusiformis TaxID=6347 RepID=A0A8J1Y1J9_OWEFU|nr:unnamed protein product [Owenia fusiformis]